MPTGNFWVHPKIQPPLAPIEMVQSRILPPHSTGYVGLNVWVCENSECVRTWMCENSIFDCTAVKYEQGNGQRKRSWKCNMEIWVAVAVYIYFDKWDFPSGLIFSLQGCSELFLSTIMILDEQIKILYWIIYIGHFVWTCNKTLCMPDVY